MNENFQVVSKLGEGGQGVVFLVKDKSSGQFYARKLIICSDLEELNVSLVEVQALLRFSHPRIVGTECFYVDEREEYSTRKYLVFIIYEYCDKDNMREFILRKRRENEAIELSLVMRWFKEMCEGIHYIHTKKYLHRDIKPSNIFLSSSKTGYLSVKIGDFGFAKFLRHGKSSTRTILGSQGYISPEMKKQEKYSGKIDCWGVLCCFIDLLTDRDFDYAFQLLDNKNVIFESIQHRYDEKIYEILCTFLNRVFLLDPKERPNSRRLLKEVEKLIDKLELREEIENPKLKGSDVLVHSMEAASTNDDDDGEYTPEVGKFLSINDSHHILKKLLEEKDEEIYFLKKSLNSYSKKYFDLQKVMEETSKRKGGVKIKTVFSHKEFEIRKDLMQGQGSIFGHEYEVILVKWKKRDYQVVCLKRPISVKESNADKFKRVVKFEKFTLLENENLEKVLGIATMKNKMCYLITEAFINCNLISFLRNFNFKLEIFGKIKIAFDVANGLYGLHSFGLVHENLSVGRIKITTVQYDSARKKQCKIIGPFRINREQRRREEDISNFLKIMEIVFCRGSDEFDLSTYKPKNEFEEEYLEIIKMGRSINVASITAKNLVYWLSKLVDKQWLHIQMLANRKKNDLSDKGMMVLRNLTTHKIDFHTSSSELGDDSKKEKDK